MDVRTEMERSLNESCDQLKLESSFSVAAGSVGNLGLSLLSLSRDAFTGPIPVDRPESSSREFTRLARLIKDGVENILAASHQLGVVMSIGNGISKPDGELNAAYMAVPWRTKENLLRDITMVSLGLEYSTRLVLGIQAQMLKWQIDSTSLLNALNPRRQPSIHTSVEIVGPRKPGSGVHRLSRAIRGIQHLTDFVAEIGLILDNARTLWKTLSRDIVMAHGSQPPSTVLAPGYNAHRIRACLRLVEVACDQYLGAFETHYVSDFLGLVSDINSRLDGLTRAEINAEIAKVDSYTKTLAERLRSDGQSAEYRTRRDIGQWAIPRPDFQFQGSDCEDMAV